MRTTKQSPDSRLLHSARNDFPHTLLLENYQFALLDVNQQPAIGGVLARDLALRHCTHRLSIRCGTRAWRDATGVTALPSGWAARADGTLSSMTGTPSPGPLFFFDNNYPEVKKKS